MNIESNQQFKTIIDTINKEGYIYINRLINLIRQILKVKVKKIIEIIKKLKKKSDIYYYKELMNIKNKNKIVKKRNTIVDIIKLKVKKYINIEIENKYLDIGCGNG